MTRMELDEPPDAEDDAVELEVVIDVRPGNQSEDEEATLGTEVGEEASSEGEVLPKALFMMLRVCS